MGSKKKKRIKKFVKTVGTTLRRVMGLSGNYMWDDTQISTVARPLRFYLTKKRIWLMFG